jgi:hypothetical protein
MNLSLCVAFALPVLLTFPLSGNAQSSVITSNSNDSFITRPIDHSVIDFGSNVVLDDEGLPTKESIQTVYDEMDYQGGVQAYLWAIPQMAVYGQYKMNKYYGATGNTDVLTLYRDVGINGMLTPNTVVRYVFNMPNLSETGPLVVEYPGGETAGVIHDSQMTFISDIGLTTPNGSNAVKYLFVYEKDEIPAGSDEYQIIRIPTALVFWGFRVLSPERDTALHKKLRIYPWSKRDNPPDTKFFSPKVDDKTYFMAQPTGMDYWKQLHEYIQLEEVMDSDRYMMARLAALGIMKDHPFNPNERQQRLLAKAALVGEKMALTASFAPRTELAKYRDDTRWVHPLTLNPDHRTRYTKQFEERTDWAFEAYGLSPAMKAQFPGKGSTYLASYRDGEGDWLAGGKHYKFTIAPDIPAARFWDVSVYDIETRGLIQNGDAPGKVNQFTKGLVKNDDGSIDIFFGPTAPEGKEANWIKTVEGKSWFTYFRLYGPTKTYFDRSWPMLDIEPLSES